VIALNNLRHFKESIEAYLIVLCYCICWSCSIICTKSI